MQNFTDKSPFFAPLSVGVACSLLESDPDMVVAGSILPLNAPQQEAQLRAMALVLQQAGKKVVLVSVDVLALTQDLLRPVLNQVSQQCQIPFDHILIHATHTHRAPSTIHIHGCQRDEKFCQIVVNAIVSAVKNALTNLTSDACTVQFCLSEEVSFGQNSRLLLGDNTIYWCGDYNDAVCSTGPFDSQLPVLAFTGFNGKHHALLYNHSTHPIASRRPNVKSPCIYGLVAQELEQKYGCPILFFNGASGSTHHLTSGINEVILRIKNVIDASLSRLETCTSLPIHSSKRPFQFKIRKFDEVIEEQAVTRYCQKRLPSQANVIAEVLRQQRVKLRPREGEVCTTWLQVITIGSIALVGVPGELFAVLGMEIKRRSPFQYTFIFNLSNDYIGYLPDQEAFRLGGYQVWMGLHSYVEAGTGENLVKEILMMLQELFILSFSNKMEQQIVAC